MSPASTTAPAAICATDPPPFTAHQLLAWGVADAPQDMLERLARFARAGLVPGEIRLVWHADRLSDNDSAGRWVFEATIAAVSIIGRIVAGQPIDLVESLWWDAKARQWVDHWEHPGPPSTAKHPLSVATASGLVRVVGVANYHEHAVHDPGGRPVGQWETMPARRLAECAELHAWSRLFPKYFAGFELMNSPAIHTFHAEAAPSATLRSVIEPPHAPNPASEIRDGRDEPLPEGPHPATDSTAAAQPSREEMASALELHLARAFADSREAWAWVSELIARDVASVRELDTAELSTVIAAASNNQDRIAA